MTQLPDNQLKKIIEKICNKHRLSQFELAEMLGYSATSLVNIKKRNDCRLSFLFTMSQKFDITIEEILGISDASNDSKLNEPLAGYRSLKDKTDLLTRLVDSKEETIEQLKQQLSYLKDQLGKEKEDF